MTIELNGQPREVPEGLTLRQLLTHLNLPADRVAVERNRAIAPRAEWDRIVVEPGDRLEVVNLVGGGADAAMKAHQPIR